MHVSYGVQGFYRQHGTEPSCSICVHYQATVHENGRCGRRDVWVSPRDCCIRFERAAGADEIEEPS